MPIGATQQVLVNASALSADTGAFAQSLTGGSSGGRPFVVRVAVLLNTTSIVHLMETYNSLELTHVLNDGTAVTATSSSTFDVAGTVGATYNLEVATGQGATKWKRSIEIVQAPR